MRRLPLFPLGTVLVPTAVLPLHIFEPRYRALMADLAGGDDHLRDDAEFGVVLITRGSEVGGGDTRAGVGTVARLLEATRLPDGRWVIAVVGTRRFRVERWLADAPYPLAEVDELDEQPWDAGDAGLLVATERRVRRALALAAEAGEPGVPVTFELDDDPVEAAWQLTALTPVGAHDRQRLLELDAHADRLRLAAGLVEEVAQLLARRLGGAE
ncbi:MAG TPA: LON peptidase substrate-binding domain-containing protein [Acidimicrobiales bacterium]|nr:LON peptidase substrate-binding domain-containing protein [Acidimicrobiales bacterium]